MSQIFPLVDEQEVRAFLVVAVRNTPHLCNATDKASLRWRPFSCGPAKSRSDGMTSCVRPSVLQQ